MLWTLIDALADPGAQAAHNDSDRVVIVTINLGSDTKLTFDKAVKPDPNPSDKIIDITPAPVPGFDT